MSDPTDGNDHPIALKFTLGNALVYLTPVIWFSYLGPVWKVASLITVGLGIWKSRTRFWKGQSAIFLLTLLIWGAHARTGDDDWPGPTAFVIWWLASFAFRWHGEGVEAVTRPRARGWE
jgi:hypothetical protein